MRTETITRNLYKFEELTAAAKETARQWWRECSSLDEWWESTYDDAERAGLKITAFDCGRAQSIDIELVECFETVLDLIIEDHGETCDTHKIAQEYKGKLAELQTKAEKCPRCSSDSNRDDQNCIEHEYDDCYYLEVYQGELKDEFLKSIGECYLKDLERELEYIDSDENVDENIECNEYEFLENGGIS